MASREEEEFELVLGNKQLLSLFFLVVVLFGVFFSFGYTVGYGRGEASVTREVGSVEPVEEPAKEVQLPETLLESAPKPVEPAPTRAEPATAQASPPPPPSRTTPAKAEPKPSPVEKATASAPPPPTRSTTPPSTAPTKSATPAATAPAKSAPAAAGSGDYQIQVLAVRVRPDAEVFLQQLKAKGHPATLSDQGDGWYRVMVGPFNSESEAKAYQPRLEKEGLESLIRKR